MTRSYGGSMTIRLEHGERLSMITWKEEDLWILTHVDTNVTPRSYLFKEDSKYGILEGNITIIEN